MNKKQLKKEYAYTCNGYKIYHIIYVDKNGEYPQFVGTVKTPTKNRSIIALVNYKNEKKINHS